MKVVSDAVEAFWCWLCTITSGISLPADFPSHLPREAKAEMQRGGEGHSTGEEGIEVFSQSTFLENGWTLNWCVSVCPHQDYLESIHQLYEDWLIKRVSNPIPAPVLVSLPHFTPTVLKLLSCAAFNCTKGNQNWLYINIQYICLAQQAKGEYVQFIRMLMFIFV